MEMRSIQTASYISDLAKELVTLAQESELPTLAYILRMVEIEAQQIALRALPQPKAA